MKPVIYSAAFAAAFALVVAAASAPSTSAPTASAAPSAAPSAERADPKPLSDLTIPTDKSDRPTPQEWKTAITVDVTRRSNGAERCRASLVREWLKVHCNVLMAGVKQFAGSPDGVLVWVAPLNFDTPTIPKHGEVILPMRKGDKRIIQFFEGDTSDYGGISSKPFIIVEESWLEGEPHPSVILR